MAHEPHDKLAQVSLLYREFLRLAMAAHFSLDDALDFLGQFVYATCLVAYATYAQESYPYPQGRVLQVFGNVLHALAHVPPSMDPQGDEWMYPREDILYPMYDGGPLLTSLPTHLPWEDHGADG
jgi:hypothetical protein